MWPRIFQGSLGCGDGSLPLLWWSNVKGPSQSAKVAKIPSQSPKILERSLAKPQIFRSLGFFEGSLTCGQGSFKVFEVWRRTFATFVLVTHQGSITERKSGKDPKPVPKDP